MATTAAPNVAWAQSSTEVSTAREVAKQGLADFDAGKYETAAQKLLQAFEVVKVPTLAVYAARALVKIGRLVEASELYLKAQRLTPAPDWPEVQLKSQREAKEARAKLLVRIPRLTVELKGASANDIELRLDGVVIASALVGAEQMVDPGTRRVAGRRGEQEVSEEVTLAEGERKSVTLRFVPSSTDEAGTAAAPQAANGSRTTSPDTAQDEGQDQELRKLLGWVAVGVGGAGVGFGAVTGLLAMSKRSTLQDEHGCVDNSCLPEDQDEVDAYNGLRTMSTVGFIAGAVVAAAGVTIVLTTPGESEPATALRLGAQRVTIEGTF
jgi:hypothetical protein